MFDFIFYCWSEEFSNHYQMEKPRLINNNAKIVPRDLNFVILFMYVLLFFAKETNRLHWINCCFSFFVYWTNFYISTMPTVRPEKKILPIDRLPCLEANKLNWFCLRHIFPENFIEISNYCHQFLPFPWVQINWSRRYI